MAQRKGLEIDQDLAFQRREWTAQRIGWWALTAFVLAAALGVFGKGPVSQARAADASGRLTIEYERFARVGAGTRLALRGDAAGAAAVDLHLSREYFDSIEIERILPEPSAIDLGPADVTMRFESPATGDRAFAVVIEVQPLHAGWLSTVIRTGQGQAVRIGQVVYF